MLPPLLEEALELALGRIALDVELKEDGYVDEPAELLSGFAASGSDLIVTSFLDPVLAQLRELASQLSRGLILGRATECGPERANACGATIVLPKMPARGRRVARRALRRGAERDRLGLHGGGARRAAVRYTNQRRHHRRRAGRARCQDADLTTVYGGGQ